MPVFARAERGPPKREEIGPRIAHDLERSPHNSYYWVFPVVPNCGMIPAWNTA
jgi:hypothetical protein